VTGKLLVEFSFIGLIVDRITGKIKKWQFNPSRALTPKSCSRPGGTHALATSRRLLSENWSSWMQHLH
jgi:hypothetical protein